MEALGGRSRKLFQGKSVSYWLPEVSGIFVPLPPLILLMVCFIYTIGCNIL